LMLLLLKILSIRIRKMITDVAPYKLIDIGANLTNPCLNDRNLCDVVDRAKAAGIHPHDAKYFNDESIAELEKLALEPECYGVLLVQEPFIKYKFQVQLACKLKKTIFIHERDAHSALVEILKKYSLIIPYAVVHCFTGTAEQAKTYLDMGLYIGLTGSLWKDKLEFGVQYALRQGIIPLNRLLVETDSPYMYPNIKAKKLQTEVKEKVSPHALQFLHHCSFQRNEPCALPTVVELIAAFSGASVDDVAINTTLNAVLMVFTNEGLLINSSNVIGLPCTVTFSSSSSSTNSSSLSSSLASVLS
ncbi:Tat-linked quality control protein TatD, partial [Trichinella murrelli]